MTIHNRNFSFFSVIALWMLLFACIPQGQDVRTIQRPAPATSPTATPTGTPPQEIQSTTTIPSPTQAKACPQGSEPAIAELRTCCNENKWGKSCDGNCWAEGTGEKLKRLCSRASGTASDCAQSPDKTKKTEWCSFHYNRRYCGVSDSDWISYCKSPPAPSSK